jgi:hypothetical protein
VRLQPDGQPDTTFGKRGLSIPSLGGAGNDKLSGGGGAGRNRDSQ